MESLNVARCYTDLAMRDNHIQIHLFGKEFVDLFNSELDRLSDSQRIGVITLLCKDISKADTLGLETHHAFKYRL